tara:strand:- start:1251 stop:1889 length:639 start_codon:yes stop_codon:yes gene_type:complete
MLEVAEADITNMALNPRDTQGDETLLVRFYIHPTLSPGKTEAAGRPIVEDVVWVEISQPGNKLAVIRTPAEPRHIARFPRHYAAFKSRVSDDEEFLNGTPLTEWAGVTRSQVEEMRFFNIRTVEQLAAMADVNTGNIMGLAGLKQKAQKYLESATDTAAANELETLRQSNAKMQEQVAQLMAAQDAVQSLDKTVETPDETAAATTRRRRKTA